MLALILTAIVATLAGDAEPTHAAPPPQVASAPQPAPPPSADALTVLQFLEGRWEGEGRGEPGKGKTTREYRRDLRGRFIVVRNRSVWEPRSAGAEPEVHEDLGVFSYDKNAHRIVLRQFHGEGFVNEYRLEAATRDSKTLTFVTERIENIADGWRAKEEYQIVSRDEIVETFSLAAPGQDFQPYSTTRLKRVR